MKRRYIDVNGTARVLILSHLGPFVKWHFLKPPCMSERWIDESGHILQIPVSAWNGFAFTDSVDQ